MNDLAQTQSGNIPIHPPFEQRNLFELLGLNHYSDQQKGMVLESLARKALQSAMQKILADDTVPDQLKDKVIELLDKNLESIEFQNELIKLFPDLTSKVADEMQKLKMEMCVKQMEDMVKALTEKLQEDEIALLEKLFKDTVSFSDRGDTENFLRVWEVYMKFKEKYNARE
jgi:hypothetical protein